MSVPLYSDAFLAVDEDIHFTLRLQTVGVALALDVAETALPALMALIDQAMVGGFGVVDLRTDSWLGLQWTTDGIVIHASVGELTVELVLSSVLLSRVSRDIAHAMRGEL